MQPRVSICVCTRNRPDELQGCLQSIRRSTLPVYETVVSDDSTDDRTARMLKGSAGAALVYVEGPRVGLGANRNKALSVVSGDYVLFLDDDACLGETFLERALARIGREGGEGRVIVSGCENNRGVMIKAHDQSFLGYQNVAYRDDTKLNTIVINSTLFPRSVFDVTRFDDQLVYGCEEVDIALQAVRRGYRIVQSDDAINFHYPSPTNRNYYKPYTDVSRLYVTFKRYAIYERARLKAATFALVGPLHCLLAAIKRRGFWGILDACKTVAAAVRLSARSLRRSREHTVASA